MGKLWAVIKREYLERVQNKWFVIATVFTPVLMAALILVPAWLVIKGARTARADNIAIIDATGAGLGARVATKLAASRTPAADSARDAASGVPTAQATLAEVRVVPLAGLAAAESLATREVMSKTLQGYLVLDTATMAGRRARYAGRNATSLSAVDVIGDAVRATVITGRLEAAGINSALADSITRGRVALSTEKISDKGRQSGNAGASIAVGIGLSFVLYMLLIVYGQVILRGVMEEKTTRVAEVVVASVKTDILLAGKVLGVGAVALTQLVAWIASTVLISGYLLPVVLRMAGGPPTMPNMGAASSSVPTAIMSALDFGTISALFIFFILGFVFYSSLFAAVGAMVNSEQEAQQAATPVMMLIIVSFIFIQPIMMDPNSTLAKVMSWLPFSAPIIMPLRMAMLPLSPLEVGASMLGVAVACVVAIWLAARIYRVGLLMYGKRPSIPELVRWIRYA
jgi:ABC-2 type transport system permease protein